MARIRTIKPAFFLNEDVAGLPFEWRLLFIGLWTQADREGRLEDRPKRLKAAIFPYDDLGIDDGLSALAAAGFIVRYERDGRRLIAIPTWAKHQQPHMREAQSELAAHEHSASTVLAPVEPVGREGKGTDQEGVHRSRFDQFWGVYPKRIGKDAAWREWLKRSPSDDLTERIVVAVNEQRASAQWLKDGGQFIPHPRTWLHQQRWEDDIGPIRLAPKASGKPDIGSDSWASAVGYCIHQPRCEEAGKGECLARWIADGRPMRRASHMGAA